MNNFINNFLHRSLTLSLLSPNISDTITYELELRPFISETVLTHCYVKGTL
jgi:hypothetical protein